MLMAHGMPKWTPKHFAQFQDIMGDTCVCRGFPGRRSDILDIFRPNMMLVSMGFLPPLAMENPPFIDDVPIFSHYNFVHGEFPITTLDYLRVHSF